MKKEQDNQLNQKTNKNLFHFYKKSVSNYIVQPENDKIQNQCKIISSNKKVSNISNKNKIKTVINKKNNINMNKANNFNSVHAKSRKVIEIKRNKYNNNIRIDKKQLNDSKKIKPSDILQDNFKSYEISTISPKNEIMTKKYKKCTLTKINKKQDYITLNKKMILILIIFLKIIKRIH